MDVINMISIALFYASTIDFYLTKTSHRAATKRSWLKRASLTRLRCYDCAAFDICASCIDVDSTSGWGLINADTMWTALIYGMT